MQMAKRGRPRIRQHGDRAMYQAGCRCQECRASASRYRLERKALAPTNRKLIALPGDPGDNNTEGLEPGRLAAAVALEIEGLPVERRSSALAALALTLADDLGRVEFSSSHASLAKQLREILVDLHAGPATPGRLAVVAGISHRPRSPAG
jgi:hypothetical protein